MTIKTIMQSKKISMDRLAELSAVPYTTIRDICDGKVQIETCTAEAICKIAKALDVSEETLVASCLPKRSNFDAFKSNVCHRVKELGDCEFLIETLEKDEIRIYYDRKWYAESFYLLAMLDYLSRLNDVPLCSRYNDLRSHRLQRLVYPSGVLITAAVSIESEEIKEQARREAIPEFMQFNIVESDIRNII